MGLKESFVANYIKAPHADKIRPKWDWKGCRTGVPGLFHPIKSDQNGIESLLQRRQPIRVLVDKIRPKWDWKSRRWIVLRNIVAQIKSDQNGIERYRTQEQGRIRKRDKIRPKWDWKRSLLRAENQRCHRIKSDQNGIESNPFLFFKIRKF